ncbi:MAG: hypothetical protein AMXMBFR83_02990 [Phycisphaerae bacterium]
MNYQTSFAAVAVFLFFVGAVLALSFYLGARARSAQGYYAAHGQIHWLVNGIAFAGDYLSAASFLGICGLIAFYGYDGFLYSIGYLAGWVVALFVVAEPLKRMGRFTFADALDNRFNSRGIKLAAAVSTLVVSLFYLIPQMVGAGALIRPLLGLPHYAGVLSVGVVVILIVVTAGMVSTTYVQFIKGSMLVIFCAVLTAMILNRGLNVPLHTVVSPYAQSEPISRAQMLAQPGMVELPPSGPWKASDYARFRDAKGQTWVCRRIPAGSDGLWLSQTLTVTPGGQRLANGRPQIDQPGGNDLHPVGHLARLPERDRSFTGALGPFEYLQTLQDSSVVLWSSEKLAEADGSVTTVYYPRPTAGNDLLAPGASPTFKGLTSGKLRDRLDFMSLMLALFGGTASLPHILIRYYTVKDQAAARKSTVAGIAAIGFFYVLTLYLGLGAMTSGALDPTDSNMAAPLLARSFNEWLFAIISAIAFTTVLGTVSGLIMAASGAVAHDLLANVLRIPLDDHGKVRAGRIAAVAVGALAMLLGVLFQRMNVSFLVGWAFNVAASANLPALIMLLFWKGTTRQGIIAAVVVGMVSSLAWILLSGQAYRDVYGLDPAAAPAPFSQPGLVTIPLGFAVLTGVSLLTRKRAAAAGDERVPATAEA